MRCNQISLGTAQFGSNYGIINKKKISLSNIKKILSFASKNGIKYIDTAHSYGDAEEVLGKIGVKNWKISSKFPSIPKNKNPKNWIEKKFFESLKRLKIKKVQSLFIHDANQLKSYKFSKKIFDTLERIKREGFIDKIGISIYSPNIIKRVTSDFKLDIIQAPANIFDKRIFSYDIQKIIQKKKIELEIRSIFLQGLILEDIDKIPKKFLRFKSSFLKIDNFSQKNNISKKSVALSYLNKKRYDRLVVGVASVKELNEIVSFIKLKKKIEINMKFYNDKYLINPNLWQKIK